MMDDRTDDCALGAMMSLRLRQSSETTFQMIADRRANQKAVGTMLRHYIWEKNIESKPTRDLPGDSHALAGQGSQIFSTSKFSPTFWLTTQRRSLAKDGPYCRRPASLSTAKSTTGLPGQGSRKPISRGNSQTLRRPPRLWLTHRGLSDSGCPAAWPPWSRHSGAGQWRAGTGPAGSIMVGKY